MIAILGVVIYVWFLIDQTISDGNLLILKQRYKEMIENETGKEIIYSVSDDFDLDGNYEMFAIVEANSEEKINNYNLFGTIWYINSSGSPVVIEDRAMEYKKNPYTITIDENVFIVFVSEQANEDIAYIWEVNNGKPFESMISGKGSDVRINEYNEIELTHITYEKIYSLELIPIDEENNIFFPPNISLSEKKSYKNYYYYFEGNAFKEFGGLKIEIDDVLKIPKGEKIINEINSHSYNIDSIYYRDNGIININISKGLYEDEEDNFINHYNIILRYVDDEWKTIWSDKNNRFYSEGSYLDALIPTIATYPNEFPY